MKLKLRLSGLLFVTSLVTAFVALGANLGDAARTLTQALEALAAPPTLVDDLLSDLTLAAIHRHKPTLVLLSVPFPGSVYAAFRIAQTIRQHHPQVRIALGGGFANTELRELAEPVVFDFVDFVTLDAGERYATGRVALVVPKNSALPLAQGLAAVVRALKPGDKFAMANPALAPYGVAAQEALLRSGAGALLAGQKVLGDNIGQAAQFVATGAAQAGITALALATAPELAPTLQVLPLPESLHGPLHQRMVLLQGASAAAVAWHQFLLSPSARAIFLRHGYALPQ